MLSIILCTIGFFLLSKIIHEYIIKPKLLLSFYRKQNILTFDRPTYEKITNFNLNFYGDSLYHQKALSHTSYASKAYAIRHGNTVILTIVDPELKKDFFVNKSHFYQKYKPHFNVIKPLIGHQNLLLKENETWKNSRKLISKIFHYDFIVGLANTLIGSSNEYFHDTKPTETNLLIYFEKLTLKIAIKIVLGEEFLQAEYKHQKIDVYLYSLIEEAIRLHRSTSWFKSLKASEFRKKITLFQVFLAEQLDKKAQTLKQSSKHTNNTILEILVDEKVPLADVLLEIITMMVAATDTTGHFLTHLCVGLKKNPEIHDRLMKELKEKIKSDEDITFNRIQSMQYLEGYIQEILRLYSPIPDLFPRVALTNHTLGDINVKKGTIVNISLMASNNDKKYFEEPHKIIPERWIKESKEFSIVDEKYPYCHLPFSIGDRNCIGQHFALLEIKIVFIKFLMEKKIDIQEGKNEIKWIRRFLYETAEPIIAKIS